ncbi:hypothetical protein HZS_8065 [Henneguya salminicola]|nr:hypothetical protein HZS_8065 [Henneguya salminicola]
MFSLTRRDSQDVSIFVTIEILCILAFSTAFSGHSDTSLYVNCLKDKHLSKTLKFKFGFPYSINTTLDFPDCGDKDATFKPITQTINESASARYFILCTFFGLLVSIIMMLSVVRDRNIEIYDMQLKVIDKIVTEMIICTIFTILFTIATIAFIFVTVRVQSVGHISHFSPHLDFCGSIHHIMHCNVIFNHHHTTMVISILFSILLVMMWILRILNLSAQARLKREYLLAAAVTMTV